MTVFAIILPTEQSGVVEALKREFAATDIFEISPTNWLVSGAGTSEDIIRKIGVYDRANPGASIGAAIAIPVTTYFGKASVAVWVSIFTETGL